MEGQNLLIERRYVNGNIKLLKYFAEELVRLKVEIIVTSGTTASLAAKNATTIIPIVIWSGGDPVLSGLVASLSRPGGNITGYSLDGPEIQAKSLALLRELLPALERVGVLEDSTNPYFRAARKEFEQACKSLGVQPIFVEVATASELKNAIAEMDSYRAQALIVPRSGFSFENNLASLIGAGLKYAIPTIAQDEEMLEAGALLTYAHPVAEQNRRAATFVDRILRGAKPSDLPIAQPTKFSLNQPQDR